MGTMKRLLECRNEARLEAMKQVHAVLKSTYDSMIKLEVDACDRDKDYLPDSDTLADIRAYKQAMIALEQRIKEVTL